MAILELRGLKVLPPPDPDDGESSGLAGGGATTAIRWGGEQGFGRSSRSQGWRRQTSLPVVDGSSMKILNSVSSEAQDDHQAIRRRSDSTKIK